MTDSKVTYANMDGDEAAATSSFPFIDTTFLYPITPATAAAEIVEQWCAQGRKNIFGHVPEAKEMEAEGGAAGALHGAGVSGSLTSTYTSSQGLLLMIPNMYKIANEMIPSVFHVASRLVAQHAMCLYCDYSDVFACRDTGFAMLCSADPQECLDFGTLAHLVTCKTRIPFLHFFDGLRTSHEIQKIQTIPENVNRELFPFEEVEKWRSTAAMSTDHASMRGCGQNSDIFWLCSEGTAPFFRNLPNEVEAMMKRFGEKTGREYHLAQYFGDPDAENVIILMGSAADTVREVVKYINERNTTPTSETFGVKGKVGVIKLNLFRPYPIEFVAHLIPEKCKCLCVLDRVKQVTAAAEPLYLETLTAVYKTIPERLAKMKVIGGKFAVGGFEFNPMHVVAVYLNMQLEKPKDRFCVGIDDDVSHTSLPIMKESISTVPEGTVQAKFFGLGADGTVGSCKSAIKLIGGATDMYTQGYFVFDAKKTGGFTFNHLRFGKERILSEYEIYDGDYVACHHHSFLRKFDVTSSLKKHGIFVLNSPWDSDEEIEQNMPEYAKKAIATREASFYTINAFAIADKLGLRGHINMIMSVCFFALSKVIDVDLAIKLLKESVVKMYSKKGETVVKQNTDAIDHALTGLKEFKYDKEKWANIEVPAPHKTGDSLIDNVIIPINRQEAHLQPVSAMDEVKTGTFRSNTAYIEKRSVATKVPHWDPTNCIQCNQCSFVCPHAVIRPFIFDPVADKAPESFKGIPLTGTKKPKLPDGSEGNWQFRIQISARDCLECGLCVNECPKKCLSFRPFKGGEHKDEEDENWEFALTLPKDRNVEVFTAPNAKETQFQQPLLEFHGACAGCNEPGHMKIMTQLLGPEIFVSNAVGCSMIWGGYTPTSPYSVDINGIGPVYATSLFEDNAEFALGISLSITRRRAILKQYLEKVIADEKLNEEMKEKNKTAEYERCIAIMKDLLANWDEHKATHNLAVKLKKEMEAFVPALIADEKSSLHDPASDLRFVYMNRDHLAKKYVIVPGGDGWAYDIDFHGIDHLLHSDEDVTVLILDTEVYSNTGGQASKATPRGATAKLATAGKLGIKKDFCGYAMSLGCCYVASVCIGANKPQYIKAVTEAVNYKGPSVIVAYCPCIAHSVKGGLSNSLEEQKLAVKSGYWPLYRFNPDRVAEGKNPLELDSPLNLSNDEWKESLKKLLTNELRFSMGVTPDKFEERVKEIEKDIFNRTTRLHRMVSVYDPSAEEKK